VRQWGEKKKRTQREIPRELQGSLPGEMKGKNLHEKTVSETTRKGLLTGGTGGSWQGPDGKQRKKKKNEAKPEDHAHR